MKRFSKKLILRIASGSVLVVFLALFLHVMVLDGAVQRDQDLSYSRRTIPSSENGWFLLDEAARSLKGVDEGLITVCDLAIRGREWNHPDVRQIVTTQMPTIDLLSEAMTYPRLQGPTPKLTENGIILPQAFSKSRDLARLAITHAHHQILDGEIMDGLETLLTVARFGHRLGGAGGGMIGWMVGRSVKATALLELRSVLETTALDRDTAMRLIRELDQLRQDPDDTIRIVKHEYKAACVQIDWFADGCRTAPTNFSLSDYGVRHVKPNRTKTRFAEAYRFYLSTVDKHYADVTGSTPPAVTKGAKLFLGGNFGGEMLYSLLLYDDHWVVKTANRADALVSVTQALIALKVFQQDHGCLPESLADLLPQYLSQAPIDPFTGGPLGYSPDKGILYVVGHDLKDDGGAAFTEALHPPGGVWDLADPSWAIQF